MDKKSKIYLAGHTGLVGSAILRLLQNRNYNNIIYRTIDELDLTNQLLVNEFFKENKPEYVFMAAAKVGGIYANETYPAEFIYQNLMIETNLIHASYLNKVKKLLFLGSSCIYPRLSPQPIKEEYLLSGSLEPTNEAYAIAKISGLKLVEYYRKQYGCDYISAMPTNLYGYYDNFHTNNSHVLPALLRKMHLAKCLSDNNKKALQKDLSRDYQISEGQDFESILQKFGIMMHNNKVELTLWGSGMAFREFLFVDDLADALLFLMDNYSDSIAINVGTGEDIKIYELAEMIKSIVGFQGILKWDTTKPDGMPKKQLDVTRLHNLGWKYMTELEVGIKSTYKWYLST
jgi:GDP-L-fucose synthase